MPSPSMQVSWKGLWWESMNHMHHPTIPYEHMCWLQSTAGSFYVRVIFLRGNVLALNNTLCLWYGYWNYWSNLYPAFLVCKPCNSHYLTLPIYTGGNLRCFWDNLWRYTYVNNYKFQRNLSTIADTRFAAITWSSAQTNLHSCREVVSI